MKTMKVVSGQQVEKKNPQKMSQLFEAAFSPLSAGGGLNMHYRSLSVADAPQYIIYMTSLMRATNLDIVD